MTEMNQAAASRYLNEAAPYPSPDEEVTADALVRHLAVLLIRLDAQVVHNGHASPDAVGAVTATWATVRLLRAAIEHDPAVADDLAREICAAWGDGSSVPEFAWEWADGYGLDAARLFEAASNCRQLFEAAFNCREAATPAQKPRNDAQRLNVDQATERLTLAVDRWHRALNTEPHADSDTEIEYAHDLMKLAARELTRAVDAQHPDRQPAGWGGNRGGR